jgi:hypothetical protein
MTKILNDYGLKVPKSNRVFLKSYKGLKKYTRLVLWSCMVPRHLYKDFMLLSSNMETVWRRSGEKFAGLYYKGCFAFIVNFCNHSIQPSRLGEIQIRSSKRGLPVIIPRSLRSKCIEGDKVIISALLTLFNIFRCIKWRTHSKVSTIVDPFDGLYNTVPMRESILKSLGIKPHKFKIKYVMPTSSGPGGRFSVLRSGLDATTLLLKYPKIYIKMIRLSLKFDNSNIFICLLILISLLNIPIWLLSKNHFPVIGRLGFLEEGAGKVRVVAMLDWWTQCLFKDIHDHIFSLLKEINEDCTFDQIKPIESFYDINRNYPTASFDLSSATDRLPIRLQSDLLNQIMGGVGDLWGDILIDRDYYIPSDDSTIKYSVGQPMGAYSSFAMLAISHHYLVRYAAYQVKYRSPSYCLLGDDIVLGRSKVFFESYRSLMVGLGVKINDQKSLLSENGNIEFTKRLWTPFGEISPIGSRNIMMSLKFWYLTPSLILDSFRKHRISSFCQLDNLLLTLPKFLGIKRKDWELLVIILLSPLGIFKLRASVMFDFKSIQKTYLNLNKSQVIESYLIFLLYKSKELFSAKLARDEDYKNWILSGVEFPSMLVCPGWWLILFEIRKDVYKVNTVHKTDGFAISIDFDSADPSTEITDFIERTKVLPGLDININNSGSLAVMKRMVKASVINRNNHKKILMSLPYHYPKRCLVPIQESNV